MNTPTITMDKEEAKIKYQEYLSVVKDRKEKQYKQLKDLYRHLSDGAKVIDIFETFKQCEKHDNGEPKIGIAPASWKEICLFKTQNGGASFQRNQRWLDGGKESVVLPSGTFKWETEEEKTDWGVRENIIRQVVVTTVPVIPALLLPESKSLNGYYILFEVDEWNEVPATKDPYLLKRISDNAFVVLAEWGVRLWNWR